MKFASSLTYQPTKKDLAILLLVSLLFQFLIPHFISKAHGAVLTEASIRLTRMGASVAASASNTILVVFKPASTATEGKIVITWPTTNAFTVSSTDADHTATTTGIPSTYQGESLNAVPNLGSPGAETAGVVTFTTDDLTAGQLYGFYVTGGITNPSAGNAGTHLVTIATTQSNDTAIDSQTVAVDTVGTNADQVTVTASINSTFNFNIADTTIALGTLTSGAISTNAMSPGIDIDTNAANGWVAWIRSEGGAATLASANASDAISSTDTGNLVTASAGSEAYLVDVAVSAGGASTGSQTVATEYDGNGTTTGGVIATSYEQIAQSTGQADSDTLTLTAIVAISPVNKAASDYTDTWQVVGAGNF